MKRAKSKAVDMQLLLQGLHALISVLEGQLEDAEPSQVELSLEGEPEKPKKTTKAKVEKPKVEAEAEKPKVEAVPEPMVEPEGEPQEPLTEEEQFLALRAKATALMKTKGRLAMRSILDAYDAAKLSDLTAIQYDDVSDSIEEALHGKKAS